MDILWQPNCAIFMFNVRSATMNVNIQNKTAMKKIKVMSDIFCNLGIICLTIGSWLLYFGGETDKAIFSVLWVIALDMQVNSNK